MKKTALVSAMFLLVCSLSGCGGDSHDSLTKEGLDLMKEYVSIVDSVHDESSAQAAKSKLEALIKKGEDLKKRGEALGKPSAEEQKKLAEKYPEALDITRKFIAAIQKQQQFAALQGLKIPGLTGGGPNSKQVVPEDVIRFKEGKPDFGDMKKVPNAPTDFPKMPDKGMVKDIPQVIPKDAPRLPDLPKDAPKVPDFPKDAPKDFPKGR